MKATTVYGSKELAELHAAHDFADYVGTASTYNEAMAALLGLAGDPIDPLLLSACVYRLATLAEECAALDGARARTAANGFSHPSAENLAARLRIAEGQLAVVIADHFANLMRLRLDWTLEADAQALEPGTDGAEDGGLVYGSGYHDGYAHGFADATEGLTDDDDTLPVH